MTDYQPVEGDLLGPHAWSNLSWPTMAGLHASLVVLVGYSRSLHGHPLGPGRPVGTGFIISARDDSAMCATAAHNFEGLHSAQNPYQRRHASALPEFVPNFASVELDPHRLRAFYRNGDRFIACVVKSAVWDRAIDVAFFEIASDEPTNDDFRQDEWLLGQPPAVGQLVGVVGYDGMTLVETSRDGCGNVGWEFESRLMLRVGRITQRYEERGIGSQALCVETSIPVFGGMSGGPAFIWPENGKPPTVFGLISSDPDDPDQDASVKNDFMTPGRSTIALLPITDFQSIGSQNHIRLQLNNVQVAD